MRKNVSVVLTAQYSPESTEKVLLGYNAQTYRNFEMLFLLSSSDTEIQQILETVKPQLFYSVGTIFVDDKDNLSENAALILSKVTTEYILFANASGIPRYDFVEQHIKYREEGFFLSGASNLIKSSVVDTITKDTIYSGVCFELDWLRANGFKSQFSDILLFSKGLRGSFLNSIFKVGNQFNFDNASLWKEDLVALSDFMKEKKQQTNRETGENLSVLGRKGKQLKFSTVVLQCDKN